MLNNIPLFAILRQKLAYSSLRQSVLAQNVSNAATPGYKAQELEPFTFSERLASAGQKSYSTMTTTHTNHIGSSDTVAGRFKPRKDEVFWETTPDGNSVVLEEQMMKLAQNQNDFNAAISLYKKGLSLMRLALSKGD